MLASGELFHSLRPRRWFFASLAVSDRAAAFDRSRARSSVSPVEAGPPPAPVDKRTQNTEQLRFAQRKLEQTAHGQGSRAGRRVLSDARRHLAQQEAVAQQIKDLETRKAKLQAQLKSPPADNKACTFAELDQLKDDLADDQARYALGGDKLESAKASIGRRKRRSTNAR